MNGQSAAFSDEYWETGKDVVLLHYITFLFVELQ